MRVALLTSANGWRGSGASYAKLARGLRDRGHSVHLVTAGGSLTGRLRDDGLDVTEISRTSRVRAVWGLRRVLRSIRAQAIVADTAHDVRLAACATVLRRTRILYRYNVHYRRPRRPLVDRMCLSRVTACVYQSRYIHDDTVKHMPRMASIPSFAARVLVPALPSLSSLDPPIQVRVMYAHRDANISVDDVDGIHQR